MEPNISPISPELIISTQITDLEAVKLNDLPVDMLQEILTKLEEISIDTNTTSKLWYKTITVIYQNKLYNQIQEALDVIIPEIENLDKNDDESIERSGKSAQVVEELKKMLSKREKPDSRIQIFFSHENIKSNIIQILKNLTETELGIVSKNLFEGTVDQSSPLYAKLIKMAILENSIAKNNNTLDSIVDYAVITTDEDKIIHLVKQYSFKDLLYHNFFAGIIDALLKKNNLDNIKTAIRLMSKLQEINFNYDKNRQPKLIYQTFKTLIENGDFKLTLKLSELIKYDHITKIYSLQLLNKDYFDVAKDITNHYYYSFEEEKKSLVYYCLKSLCLEGKIDEFFVLVDKILNKTSIGNKDITEFFRDNFIKKDLIAKMPVKNLEQMRDRITQNSALKVRSSLNLINERIDAEKKTKPT